MPRKTTIVDLARELGLSKTTVSDALNGRGRVSDETRERIATAAAELGYVVNRAARSMRSSTTGAIGLYIPPVVRSFSFYMDFAFGAAQAAAGLDVDLTLFAREQDAEHPRRFSVDGAIVVDPLPDDPMVGLLLDGGVPVVTAGRDMGRAGSGVAGEIVADHQGLFGRVLDRLHDHGVRRPAFLGSDALFFSSWASEVAGAHDEWCAAHGIEPARGLVSVSSDEEALRDAVSKLVAIPGVDALVCGPQGFGGRAVAALAHLGITAGPDFPVASLVADPVTELPNPLVTAVDLAPWSFGYEATLLLDEVLCQPIRERRPILREHSASIRFADYLG